MIKNICIVGAGFAGLTSARVLTELGFDITLYEKEVDVGGVWSASRRYPGLNTQNPRDTYAVSDYPMPRGYPEWPSSEQVQRYLQNYTEYFGFDNCIELSTEVVYATYDESKQKWLITTRQAGKKGAVKEKTELFDYLIIGNGIFSVPSIPNFPGSKEFVKAGGKIIHTSQFYNHEDARDKDVLVIGYGKSSCDVANALVDSSKRVTVVARNLLWKIPKMLGNILNFKYLFFTRMGEGLFRYIRLKGFEKFLHGVGKPMRQGMLNSVQWVIEKQLKLKELDLHPEKPLETIARSTVSNVTTGFYDRVRAGELFVKKYTEIKKLTPGKAELSNGEILPADIILCGTGWHQECPFLDPKIMKKVTDEKGNFRLYLSMIPVGVPRLAFNGYNSSFFSQLNCEVGAFWVADLLLGGLKLPSEAEQNKYIDERLAWMEARTDGKHAKGTNIIPFSIHHMDELLNDMNMNLGLMTRFKQWFAVLDPGSYSKILPKLKKKYNR